METKLNVLETNFEELGLLVLDENEAVITNGGEHLEWRDGQLVLVPD